MKEKWAADFSKPEKSCFDIKPEISFDAYLEKGDSSKENPIPKTGALFLGVKNENRLAWLETKGGMYTDQCIEASLRIDGRGVYCAAGIMFRISAQGTYYLALVSGKGYFRLDAVNNGIPRALTGWVETPCPAENEARLKIIALGCHMIFLINGEWVAEAYDDSIPGGHLGFALASYNGGDGEKTESGCICGAWLEGLSLDSRRKTVDAEYGKWTGYGAAIGVENRLRLAESFAALEKHGAALDQILKAWKQREEAARSVTATFTEMRTGKELLFAARMAFRLEQYAAAEEYIDACLALSAGAGEGTEALAEKVKILNAQNRFDDLAELLPSYIQSLENEKDSPESLSPLYTLLGRAWHSLEKHRGAAVTKAKKKPSGTKKAPAAKSGKAAAKKPATKAKTGGTAAAKKPAARAKTGSTAAAKKPAAKAKASGATTKKPAAKAKSGGAAAAKKPAVKAKAGGTAAKKPAARAKADGTAAAKKPTARAKAGVKKPVKKG